MEVAERKISDLKEYENNPRLNDDGVDKLVTMIREFGFRVPILVSGNEVVDGHMRLKAARKLKLKTVPVIDVSDLPPEKVKALRISINKSAELADWDVARLTTELEELGELGFDLSMTGFDPDEITGMLGDIDLDDVDDGLAPPEDGQSSPQSGETASSGPAIPKNKDADAGAPAVPDYVSITFHMTKDQREKLLAALKSEAEKRGLQNMSSALLAIVLETAGEA